MSFFSSRPILTPSPIDTERFGKPRAALMVHRHLLGQPNFLLISSRRDAGRLTLPGGKIDPDETALQTAVRETQEEAGVLTEDYHPLGSYLHHKQSGRIHPTQTFLARFVGQTPDHEPRDVHWLTLRELADTQCEVRDPIREIIELAAEILPAYTAAA